MKNKKIKCDIYTRVSTTMQVDGYSLDAQKEKLKRDVYKRQSLYRAEIIRTFFFLVLCQKIYGFCRITNDFKEKRIDYEY